MTANRLLHTMCIVMMFTVGILVCSCGCDLFGTAEPSDEIMLLTYNVQNLFDVLVTGNEYPEYTPEEGWTAALYQKRLEQTARAITQNHGRIPDIVVLQEIEHAGVLHDLLAGPLAGRKYQWFAATDDDSAIQTGVLSAFPLVKTRVHTIENHRSVLEVMIEAGKETIVVFALHAKSQREGMRETEAARIALCRMINQRVAQLRNEFPFTPIVIAGDFNESADAYFRENQDFQTALVPVQALEVSRWKQHGSCIVGGSPPASDTWYTWWLDSSQVLGSAAPGSYYYHGIWESFDQLLLSREFFDGFGWEFIQGDVAGDPSLLDDDGHPFGWNVQTGKGISDHLPVTVTLSFR
jgi:endonuclease/exonuclease/phosphatase family metal-dependent hydrolase